MSICLGGEGCGCIGGSLLSVCMLTYVGAFLLVLVGFLMGRKQGVSLRLRDFETRILRLEGKGEARPLV